MSFRSYCAHAHINPTKSHQKVKTCIKFRLNHSKFKEQRQQPTNAKYHTKWNLGIFFHWQNLLFTEIKILYQESLCARIFSRCYLGFCVQKWKVKSFVLPTLLPHTFADTQKSTPITDTPYWIESTISDDKHTIDGFCTHKMQYSDRSHEKLSQD